jgi:hypothetical protein
MFIVRITQNTYNTVYVKWRAFNVKVCGPYSNHSALKG